MHFKKCFRFPYHLKINNNRQHCTKATNVIKSVYISECEDVYTNLALEDWFYQNLDFSSHHILLLWKNAECVVIGRHQNPWLESNVHLIETNKEIKLARRNSGGGAVYHDTGNLNATFFAPRKCYNRTDNLSVIVKAIQREWDIKTEINHREDIVFNGSKISGTASKLGTKNTYHHCTLLIDSNKNVMSQVLSKNNKGIVTNATTSTRSKVINLRELNSTICVDRLITVIGTEYLRTCDVTKESKEDCIINQHGFSFVIPNEQNFPGITKKIEEFGSWDWRFGRTPKFKVEKRHNFSNNIELVTEMRIEVEHGIINNIVLNFPTTLLTFVTKDICNNIVQPYLKLRFSDKIVNNLERSIDFYLRKVFNNDRIAGTLSR